MKDGGDGGEGGDGSKWSILNAVISSLIARISLAMVTVGHMLLDPLFLYVPTINENIKCLALDEKLKNTAIVLRSFTDVPFLLKILGHVLPTRRWRLWQWRLLGYLVYSEDFGFLPESLIHKILAVLPIPQTFMQATSRTYRIWALRKRSEVIIPRIDFMLSEYGLARRINYAILELVREALEQDEDRPTENIFSLLPWLLQYHMKRHLVLATLQKEPGLENIDRLILEEIMEQLEPVNYADGSYIIREGEPLDRTLFITQGSILTYKTSSIGGGSGSSSIIHLAKCEFY